MQVSAFVAVHLVDELEDNAADAPQVGSGVVPAQQRNLGRPVPSGANVHRHAPRPGLLFGVVVQFLRDQVLHFLRAVFLEQALHPDFVSGALRKLGALVDDALGHGAGQPEVADLDLEGGRLYQHVGRLDVPVDYVVRVDRGHRVQQVVDYELEVAGGQLLRPGAVEEVPQVHAEVLHDHVDGARAVDALRNYVQYLRTLDPAVPLEGLQDFDFAKHPHQTVLVQGDVGDDLDGHVPRLAAAEALVDRPMSSLAQLLGQRVSVVEQEDEVFLLAFFHVDLRQTLIVVALLFEFLRLFLSKYAENALSVAT